VSHLYVTFAIGFQHTSLCKWYDTRTVIM